MGEKNTNKKQHPKTNTIVEDVLLYLPEWTNQPRNKPYKDRPTAFLETQPHTHKPVKYQPDKISPNEYKHINTRKHITNKEIIQTYHRIQAIAAAHLNRREIPDNNACYNATIMWTAGFLEDKYNFTTTRDSPLIRQAKEMLRPYYNYNPQILGKPAAKKQCTPHDPHHHHGHQCHNHRDCHPQKPCHNHCHHSHRDHYQDYLRHTQPKPHKPCMGVNNRITLTITAEEHNSCLDE